MNGNHQQGPASIRFRRIHIVPIAVTAAGVTSLLVAVMLAIAPPASAATTIDLGTADTFSVLGGQSVSNTGPSFLAGDLGVHPGTAISGFPPGIFGGAKHPADAVALQAQSDLTSAYDIAAGSPPSATVAGDLVGRTLQPGVYKSTSTLDLTGTVTLDAQGDPAAVFIFQVGSKLTTFSASHVVTINGTDPCHVFWQIGSSATLGTFSTFSGTIMALTSISVQTGAVVHGRALARNGSVTLDDDVFTAAACNPAVASAAASAYGTSAASSSAQSSSAAALSSSAAASAAAAKSSSAAVSSAAARSAASSAAARSSLAAVAARSSAASPAATRTSAVATSPSASITTTATSRRLANTGPRGPVGPLLGVGILLLGLGAVLLTVVRRNRRRTHGV
ncbi:MAG: hypothetical protein JWO57_3856 [Pseudonocardiales bacterium]|nr:hypothetical protein [Pseudonocardiales bacterium]